MSKGTFTQGVAILLSGAVPLDAVRQRLAGTYTLSQDIAASGSWEFGGPSFTAAYKPEINGYVVVDLVAHPWPDHMGSPKEEATLFGAWGMGQFGPYAYPHGLRRATEQAWAWNDAAGAVAQHRAFIRIRTSYVFGAGDDAAILPAQYDPLAELEFTTGIVQQLVSLPETICYFNPNGEKLMPASELNEAIHFNRSHGLPALDAWCNIRMFNLDDNWLMMDTVGNHQLDIADHEAAFPKTKFSPQDVDHFLRNASLYILKNGDVIKDGDTMDGPGDVAWQAHMFENGLTSPPRSVIRWIPVGAKNVPSELMS